MSHREVCQLRSGAAALTAGGYRRSGHPRGIRRWMAALTSTGRPTDEPPPGRGETRSSQHLIGQHGARRLFDRLATEPCAQALASSCSTALLCERPPSNPVEPRQRVLWQRRASAPCHHEDLSDDLISRLAIGSTKRVAVHWARITLIQASHGLHLIASHTLTMAGNAARITCDRLHARSIAELLEDKPCGAVPETHCRSSGATAPQPSSRGRRWLLPVG